MHSAIVIKSGNQCHTSMEGVMAHTGFGPVYLKVGKYTLMIPSSLIKKDGTLKKSVYKTVAQLKLAAA